MAMPGVFAASANSSKHLGWSFLLIILAVGMLVLWLGVSNAASENVVLADEPAIAQTADRPVKSEIDPLTPEMRSVLNHVSRRFRVAAVNLEPIFAAAQEAGAEHGIDPLLIISVMGIESGFNPFAESSMGAQGLMQVIPRFHLDKVPADAGELPFLDPVTNVRIGVDVLREAIQMRGSLIAGLQQYGGSTDPNAGYANKVLAEKQRLERIAGRVNQPAA
jgi:hypothetical protein